MKTICLDTEIPLPAMEMIEDLLDGHGVNYRVEESARGMTVAQARASVLAGAERGGVQCPCCGQRAQVYRRSIHSAMARDLIACYRQFGVGEWFDLTAIVGKRGTGDVTKLRYWGLMEQMPGEREDGSKRTGCWRILPRGADYVRSRVRVQKYAYVYDGEAIRFDGPLVSIHDALGEKFDYRELMAA